MRLAALAFAALPFLAAAADPAPSDAERLKPGEVLKSGPFKVDLKPGAMHEDCVALKAGQKRPFGWTSNTWVDFNVHYHGPGDKVEMPIDMPGQYHATGTFVAPLDQTYCWMWTARKLPVTVEGFYRAIE